MKARNKNSNEIVDVYFDYFYGLWTVKGNPDTKFAPNALELLEEKDIDWEERRYEIAKQMLTVTSNFTGLAYNGISQRRICCEDAVLYAIKYADALIAELKKGGEK